MQSIQIITYSFYDAYTQYFDRLMQERHNSIANTLELCLSFTNLSIGLMKSSGSLLYGPIVACVQSIILPTLLRNVCIHTSIHSLYSATKSGPIFCLLLRVSSDYAQPITGQVTSLAQSKLRLCSANHRTGYWRNLSCDWLSTAWAYSEQETENGPICLLLPVISDNWAAYLTYLTL